MAKKAKKTGRSPKKGAATRAAMADMQKKGKLYRMGHMGTRRKALGAAKGKRGWQAKAGARNKRNK